MGQGETLNLGQISAIWISPNAPENLQLIWYDITERVHKVFDTSSREWTALNPQVVTNSTIDTLRNIAINSGLSIGKFFFLTDVGTLAIAITTTKIWYVDSQNNYVVNDLATSIVSYINSNNLLIDGSTGVWNTETGKLEFRFTEIPSSEQITQNDYIVLRRSNGTIASWIKMGVRGIISSIVGNSIIWNKGLFFNFEDEINKIKNKIGGILGYDHFVEEKESINTQINTISRNQNTTLLNAKTYTDGEVTAEKIYGKSFSEPWNLLSNPPSVPNPETRLRDLLNILISWVQLLQNSNKIKVGSGFAANGRSGNVNYSDTVLSAIEKLVYKIKNIWDAEFRNADWSAMINVGDKIGEFDAQGNPRYTASLEGAVYLLSKWYDSHFNFKTADWGIVNGYYSENVQYDYGGGGSAIGVKNVEGSCICQYRIFENTFALKSDSKILVRVCVGNMGYNILTDANTDDVTLTFRDLPAVLINALINKYGKNRPFPLNIPFICKASNSWGTIHDDTAIPYIIARGNLYGVVISTFIDSVEYNYLKLIPYCIEFEERTPRTINTGEGGEPTIYAYLMHKEGVNLDGLFSTDWVLSKGTTWTEEDVNRPRWQATILPFCIEMPLS